MSIWTRIGGAFSSLAGRKAVSTLDLFRQIYGGRESASGVSVTVARAIEVATVLACVRVLANGVAQVPFRVYRDDGTGKAVAAEHPLQVLLRSGPNPYQTSYAFRETMVLHLALTGNFFAWKGMVGSGRVLRSLEPMEPGRTTVKRAASGALSYEFRADDGAAATFGPDEVWHVRGPSWNAWAGMDAVKLARDAIGLAIATEQTQAELHRNGAKVSGLLSVDEKLSIEKYEFLATWLDKHAVGGERSQKPLILDMGAKFTPFQLNGVDAQHLETRKHQIEEICRAFGVMPIMVGHADKTATYASAEQMFLAHVVHTLSPWYARLEQSADASLLSTADRADGYYTKFSANALMRGAAKDRGEFYAKALGAGGAPGWMTPNDVRGLEELDPIDGGDRLFWPQSSVAAPGGTSDTAPEPSAP